MQGKYPVVTLCGSTRFKDEFCAEEQNGREEIRLSSRDIW